MRNPSDELFNKRFSWLLAGIALAGVAIGVLCIQQLKAPLPRVKHDKDTDFHPSGPMPTPPQWVKEVPVLPEWWNEVVATNYEEGLSANDKFARKEEMESGIKQKVIQGTPPVRERRELIKYLSLLANSSRTSPGDRSSVMHDTARTYGELGDHRTAAKIR